jgi:hypothetical protein
MIKMIFYMNYNYLFVLFLTKMNTDIIECKVEKQGSGEIKRWYKNGKIHRDDGPAIITSNGAQHWYQNGELHKDDGPALICPYGSQHWYKHGLGHREDGPAVITDGYEEWKINGKLHRVDGPAYKHYSYMDHEHWYFDGKLHRDDGPAVIQGNYKSWYIHGELHRVDGPAIQARTINYFYLFNERYNEDKFNKLLSLVRRFNNNLKRKYQVKVKNTIYDNTNICKDVCGLISQYVI